MKTIILARVSTLKQEQEGLSLREMQLPRLRDYASSKGFEIDKEFVFSESADQKIRTKFIEMIDYIKNNPAIKHIVAFRVDRVTRNFRDAVLIDGLMKDHDIELHFVEDRLVINKNSVGRDIQDWDLKVFLGKQYINRLKEDAVNSAYYKLRNGEFPGKAPFGYKNVSLGKKKKWIDVDPINADIVKTIYDWYATGLSSMPIIRRRLKEEFNLNMSKGKIDQILKSKFYIGIIEYKDQEYSHKYDQIIATNVFEKVQAIKASYGKKPGAKFAGIPFLYRGLIRCADCGAIVSPEKKKSKYVYYKCTEYHGKHGAQYLREEELTRQLCTIFKQIDVPQWVAEEIHTSLKESQNAKKSYAESLLKDYRREYDKYSLRIDNMYADKLDGLITADEFQQKSKEFKNKQLTLKVKMDQLEDANDNYYQAVESLLLISQRASQLFESSESDLKRLFVKLTLQNLRLKGQELIYDWAEPFNVIVKHTNSEEWLPRLGSNQWPIG